MYPQLFISFVSGKDPIIFFTDGQQPSKLDISYMSTEEIHSHLDDRGFTGDPIFTAQNVDAVLSNSVSKKDLDKMFDDGRDFAAKFKDNMKNSMKNIKDIVGKININHKKILDNVNIDMGSIAKKGMNKLFEANKKDL